MNGPFKKVFLKMYVMYAFCFVIFIGGVKCFSFYYHMYGANMGKLMVTVTAGDKKRDWIQVGDHGNSWKIADIAIKTSENFIVGNI